jgi:hypothetical protein
MISPESHPFTKVLKSLDHFGIGTTGVMSPSCGITIYISSNLSSSKGSTLWIQYSASVDALAKDDGLNQVGSVYTKLGLSKNKSPYIASLDSILDKAKTEEKEHTAIVLHKSNLQKLMAKGPRK